MAGSKSDYLEAKVLDHLLGGTTYSPLATVYVGLFSAAPSDTGGGTELSNGTSPGYARVSVTNNTTNWPNATGTTTKSNGTVINFPTATGNWVTATHMGIFDASSAGNLLWWASLTTSRSVLNGQTAQFLVGSIVITED